MKIVSTAVVLLCLGGPVLAFGKIERACNQSDRTASRSLCTCIQRVANVQLTSSDQSLAAKFFKDPHLAQEVRQSDSSSKERFWKRYVSFGKIASKNCS